MSKMLFEYKVRAKHRLGFKEFSFYATTNIEEFLNRNSIDYVRNMTDTIEHRQLKEIERLHSIIKEVRENIEELAEDDGNFIGEIDRRRKVELLEMLDKENK